MKPFEQTCIRIAAALEMLVAEEALALRARELETALQIQQRAAPLVDFLVAHKEHAAGARTLIEGLRARRQDSGEHLAGDITAIRDELCALEFSRRKLARIGPAYGSAHASPQHLSATG
jgi:hypothetical protein